MNEFWFGRHHFRGKLDSGFASATAPDVRVWRYFGQWRASVPTPSWCTSPDVPRTYGHGSTPQEALQEMCDSLKKNAECTLERARWLAS